MYYNGTLHTLTAIGAGVSFTPLMLDAAMGAQPSTLVTCLGFGTVLFQFLNHIIFNRKLKKQAQQNGLS